MTESKILALALTFDDVTRRAIKAVYDGVALHGAHSFLLLNFFSTLFIKRAGRGGWILGGSMQYFLVVLQEVINNVL